MKTLQSSPVQPWTRPAWARAAAALLAGAVCVRGALEFYWLAPISGELAGKFSVKWGGAYLVFLAALAAVLAVFLTALFRPQWLAQPGRMLIVLRDKLGGLRGLLVLLTALLLPAVLLFTPPGEYLSGAYLRLLGLIVSAVVIAFLLTDDETAILQPSALLLGLAIAASTHLVLNYLTGVSNYPFSLSWSEGNRLYDNSVIFGADRYRMAGELSETRGGVGRYLLWGLPFLIPDAPIWVHRLWNALLSVLPHLALGYVLARQTGLSKMSRWLFALWVFLFLAQGPIYTPLIISALLVVIFVRPGKPVQSILAAAAAGYYASLSRWTWLPAVPAWTVFLMLPDLDPADTSRMGAWRAMLSPAYLRRLLPVALAALAALGSGLLANPKLLQPQKLSQGTALSQPLLWYRLWPNATYPEGVLLALIIASAPVIALLLWLALSKSWQVGRLQAAAYLAAGAVFLGGGIVASVKIGGGNNLHNLDMFLVTLAILAGLALRKPLTSALTKQEGGFPGWVRLALALAVLLPAWSTVRGGAPLKLPAPDVTRKALENIRTQTADAAKQGEVLFLDQRQLLTFGYIENVDLVESYELKYMMDQAMAGDSAYFEGFYRDLADQRFSLIVSDIQFKSLKDSSYAFGEENNAWVKWVAQPLTCYYMPLRSLKNVDIQLLVPNPEAKDCPDP